MFVLIFEETLDGRTWQAQRKEYEGDYEPWQIAERLRRDPERYRNVGVVEDVDAPASVPADPFMPSPEVRAALRIMYADVPAPTLQEEEEAYDLLCEWVQSWPQE